MFDRKPKKRREIARLAVEATAMNETVVENVAPLIEDTPQPAVNTPIAPQKRENSQVGGAVCIEETQTMAQLRFAEVKALQKQGLSKRAISKQVGVVVGR